MSEIIKTKKCPICHRIFTDEKYAPFCSKRCADIDLHRWFNGDYAVPSEDMDELETQELSEALDNAKKDR